MGNDMIWNGLELPSNYYFKDDTDSVLIYCGDCKEVLPLIPDKSIDFVLTDPPYGTTVCSWDTVIPFDVMWELLMPLRKATTPIVLFGSEPFSSYLRVSNIREFKYDWVWKKNRGSNFATVKYQPMKEHELISVFCAHNYYPIKQSRSGGGLSRVGYKFKPSNTGKREAIGRLELTGEKTNSTQGELRFPSSVQEYNTEVGLHPTQKPVALIEYLIKTYSLENDIVLDFTLGSGTTVVATKELNRKCIGIEIEEKYCEIAAKRCSQSVMEFKC